MVNHDVFFLNLKLIICQVMVLFSVHARRMYRVESARQVVRRLIYFMYVDTLIDYPTDIY